VSQGARRAHALALLATALAGALVLGWNLGDRYLWQDEAATAVLAERMLRFGRPLGWDGRNLVTMDFLLPEELASTSRWAGSADAALRHYVERGDFKPDTTWIGQPWGQFALTAASFQAFGRGTLQARLPFAACGVLALVLLHHLARRRLGALAAAVATALLLCNVFWILHTRQCRYYAASGLPLLAALAGHLRWRAGGRGGATLFVAAAFALFQIDFGTFWPVLGVFAGDALLFPPRGRRRALALLAALLACVAPFALYYEIGGRLQETALPFGVGLVGTAFLLNQYELPFLALPAVAWLAWRERRAGRAEAARLVALALALVLVLLAWVPLVAPLVFHRYVVAMTPLAALALGFALARGAQLLLRRRSARAAAALAAAALLAASPLASNAFSVWIPRSFRHAWHVGEDLGGWLRPELAQAWLEISGRAPDPNRDAIELLRPRLAPGEEILVSYEDVPFMFYLDQPIRGGIGSFRVLADDGRPPRFAVLRRVPWVDWPVYQRALERQRWRPLPVGTPDVPISNSPDPTHRYFPRPPGHRLLQVLERVAPEPPAPGARAPTDTE
jgi:hypothetical protein